VNRFPVFQCHHTQIFTQLLDENPMADATIWLHFAVYRLLKRLLASFPLDVRALA